MSRVAPSASLRWACAGALAVALDVAGGSARAAPQYNAGLLAGIGGQGEGSAVWEKTVFYGGARGDVILGRQGPRDFGVGPYVAVTTAAFDDARFAGGGSVHLPIDETFPLVVSAGAFAAAFDGAPAPGVQAQVFFGSRSYNYHADYGLAVGLVAGVDHTFDDAEESVFVIAAQIDGLLVALPFLVLGQAL